jgi:predicted porin
LEKISMKKTLIALAAVAATGAAFAQSSVNLTGKLRFAYEATKDTTAAGAVSKANGIKVTDGDFALTAVEDLGGGMKAIAFMNVQSRGRDTAISGRDAYIALTGGFGKVLIGSIEAGNGIIGLGGAGAPVYGMDGSVIAGAGNVDILQYTSPSFSGFNASVTLTDGTTRLGMESTSPAPKTAGLGLAYANGPIAVKADYTDYTRNAYDVTKALTDKRVRLSGSYDLGVVKLGAGYEQRKYDAVVATGKTTDLIFGVTAPVASNVTLGLNFAQSKRDGAAQKRSGVDFGAQYDLSKRTYVAFHVQSTKGNATYTAADKTQAYRVQLSHAF